MHPSIIDRVEIHEFPFEVENLGVPEKEKSAIYNLGHSSTLQQTLENMPYDF